MDNQADDAKTPPQKEHPHPRRHRRARLTAQTVGGVGLLAVLVGLVYILLPDAPGGGWPIALIPLGATTVLLAAIWYFTYMENLEPELYQHEEGYDFEDEGPP